MKQEEKKTLKLLIVSDIHESMMNVERLEKWYLGITKVHPIQFDYVLVPGDTGNVPYKKGETNEKEQIESEAKMVTILNKLQVYGAPILYIPGNHDCQVQYQGKQLTEFSNNIHKGAFQLAQDLQIRGFGGSVPGYLQGKEKWQGYPFNHQSQYQVEFKCISEESGTQQLILMSHVGPSESSTTIDYAHHHASQTHPMITGSLTLNKYVKENYKRLVLNVHGHTHESTGICRYWDVPILNPGSLSQGNFGILSLSRREKWRVEKIELINLNDM